MGEIKMLEINGVHLAYKEYGTGDKYLLSTQNFFFDECHMALLGQAPYDYHVYLIYTRGYGPSEHIYDAHGPADYATMWGRDVIAFAKALGIERFYYSGVSHGNWAGWYIGFHRPELLLGFVCCDGIAQYPKNPQDMSGRPLYQRKDECWLDETVGNREQLENMAWNEHWPTQNPDRLKRRLKNHQEHLEIMVNRKREEYMVVNNNTHCSDARSEEEFYNALAEFDFPVMIINGMQDHASTPEKCLKIACAIPGCELLLYQHLPHGGPDECPEMIAQDCDRFFKDTLNRIL